MSTVAPEVNALLAVLMDTPGLRQEQIGPMLRKLEDVAASSIPRKPMEEWTDHEKRMESFWWVIDDMLEAWEG